MVLQRVVAWAFSVSASWLIECSPLRIPYSEVGAPAGQHLIHLWHDGLDRLVQPRPDGPRLWIARDAQPPHGRCIVTQVEAV